MNKFRNVYSAKNQAKPSKELIQTTIDLMNQEIAPGRRIQWKFAIPAIALLLMSSTFIAYAAGVLKFADPIYKDHVNNTSTGVQAVSEKVDRDNLIIAIDKYACDNETMYINLNVETKDGSPMQELTDNSRSILARQHFENSYLECEGKQYPVHFFRTDNVTIPNKAKFEAMINSGNPEKTLNFDGKYVRLVLGNYVEEIESSEDIGFKFKNLDELYKQMTPLKSSDFINAGPFIEFANGSKAYSYIPPKGNQHIQFSDKYPGAYIDNIGFCQYGEVKNLNALYISIVPGSVENKDALKNLGFKNKDGGSIDNVFNFNLYIYKEYPVYDSKFEKVNIDTLLDGRIILTLYTDYNHQFDYNMTEKDLLNFTIANNLQLSKPKTRFEGNWSLGFNVEQSKSKVFNVNKDITIKNQQIEDITIKEEIIKITSVELSPLTLKFKGERQTDQKLALNGSIFIIMKDGSEIPVGVKIGGSIAPTIDIAVNLEHLVDVDQVAGLKICGNVIDLK